MAAQPKRPIILKTNLVIDCAPGQADTLAQFYTGLLGWNYTHPAGGGWAAITAPDGTVYAFQEVEGYQPPVWPWQPGTPGQMLHLDYYVEDLDGAVVFAQSLGARLAPTQYFQTSRTLFDPAGHPFCLDTDEAEPE